MATEHVCVSATPKYTSPAPNHPGHHSTDHTTHLAAQRWPLHHLTPTSGYHTGYICICRLFFAIHLGDIGFVFTLITT